MKILKISTILTFCIITFSCTISQKYEFEEQYKIEGNEILTDELDVTTAYIIDSLLLLKTRGSQGIFFKVYDVNSLEKIGEFGEKGEGPLEFMATRLSGDYIEENGEKLLLISDPTKLNIKYLNLSNFVKNGEEKYERELNPNVDHGVTQAVYQLNDSILVSTSGIDILERGRLIFYNLKSDVKSTTELFPQVKDHTLDPYSQYALYFSHITVNKGKKLIASAMDAFNRVDIFSFDGELVTTAITGNSDFIVNNENLTNGNALVPYNTNYMHIASTNDYIYALHYDQDYMEIGKIEIEPSIKVFTWEGKFKCQLNTPDYISTFSVTSDNSKIIAVDNYSGKIIEYNISEIMNSPRNTE